MTAPAEAARLFLWAVGLGAGAGIVYTFVRPLRPRFTWLADLLFILVLFYLWLEHSFRLCRGDIRPGNTFGILMGAFLSDRLLGRLLQPVFTGFWKILGGFFRILLFPLKKIMVFLQKILNFLLLKIRKMFTIEGSPEPGQEKEKPGGVIHYGSEAQAFSERPRSISKKRAGGKDRHHRAAGGLHRDPGSSVHQHRHFQSK